MNGVADQMVAGLPLGQAQTAAPDFVLLHGWGSDARVMAALAVEFAGEARVSALDLPGFGRESEQEFPADPQQLIAWLLQRIPPGAVLIGWSLGGAIALLFADACPGHLGAVVTIATNPRFLRAADWPHAMDPVEFAAFRAAIVGERADGLGRFAALQARGDHRPREVLRQLRSATAHGARDDDLLRALDLLATLDLRGVLAGLELPVLHILGECDVLVPPAVGADCLRLQPHACVWVAQGVSHAPFLSRGEAVGARIREFVRCRTERGTTSQRNKADVARSFGRAAPGYEAVAHLQRSTGTALLEMLGASAPATVVDIGSGTGYFAAALSERYPTASVIALDIAEAMVHEARAMHGGKLRGLCADAEQLPLADASVDVIFSNLALQWCEDLPGAMCEIARVLVRGGCAAICTLGADTLWELRAAWRTVDQSVHVNRFATTRAIADAAAGAGLEVVVLHQCNQLLHYSAVRALARELRQLGAHNLNRGRRGGLSGRAIWERLEHAYQPFADAAGIPATYQAVWMELKKAHD